MSARWVHVSVEMMPNPLRAMEIAETGASRLLPYIRDPERSHGTYRCRDGQVRGKAAKKAAKRLRVARLKR